MTRITRRGTVGYELTLTPHNTELTGPDHAAHERQKTPSDVPGVVRVRLSGMLGHGIAWLWNATAVAWEFVFSRIRAHGVDALRQ